LAPLPLYISEEAKARTPALKKRIGSKAKRTVKRRSAAAASLADPRYRKRVVKSAKAYSRKGKATRRTSEADAEADQQG
jgi:hypothetical protein